MLGTNASIDTIAITCSLSQGAMHSIKVLSTKTKRSLPSDQLTKYKGMTKMGVSERTQVSEKSE
ncbi:MAG: hypothetical protein PUD88_06000 [Prevotellaceae bacterium]|nr:hypothetical protein [Prevotellaceae bacterium]